MALADGNRTILIAAAGIWLFDGGQAGHMAEWYANAVFGKVRSRNAAWNTRLLPTRGRRFLASEAFEPE
jgi:hypothetical protein